MQVKGIVFAGTATPARAEMSRFVRDVLGLLPGQVEGIEADLFDLPDGSSLVVAFVDGIGDTERSVGFLVDDVEAAAGELRAAGTRVDAEISSNARYRYIHFWAPDGQIYELVEETGRTTA